MSRWFRLYDDTINDPKILKLSDKLHRIWIGILCATSKNDGKIPALTDLALMIRMKPEKLNAAIQGLINSGLIDDDGVMLSPHNWDKRQYKSDVSTERVKRFRNGERNASETPPENRLQITDTEKKEDMRAVAKATRPKLNEAFDEFWKVYPKRDGANPKAPSLKKFIAAVKSGADPVAIIGGAQRYAVECARLGQIKTSYVAQAVTWLNQKRWEDYPALAAVSSPGVPIPPSPDMPSDDQLRRKYADDTTERISGASEVSQVHENGDRSREDEGNGVGRKSDASDCSKHPGMAGVETILPGSVGVDASRNDVGGERADEGKLLHGSGAMAGVVRCEQPEIGQRTKTTNGHAARVMQDLAERAARRTNTEAN